MKIDLNEIRRKLELYFKESLDRTIVVIILAVAIINALFASVLFYFIALNPEAPTLKDMDYKEIKIRVKKDVLEKMESREEINRDIQEKINSLQDPFKEN